MLNLAERDHIEIDASERRIAESLKIVPNIHSEDFIFQFLLQQKFRGNRAAAIKNYYQTGSYSAGKLNDIINKLIKRRAETNDPWTPQTALDFASGYGSVARHLPNVAPTLHLSACDIHPQAVSFLKDVLSIDAFQSDTDPKRLELPKFDVVFALSFFSHLPKRTFAGWLEALFAAVNPGGVLIFTTHGEYAHKKVLAYIKTLIVDDEQFGFVPGSEQRDLNRDDYGVTVCYPPFVISRLQHIPGVRLAQFSESDWWNVQDTYACIKSYS